MASYVWNGAAADGNHDTAGNWVGGAAPSGVGPHDITFNNGNYSMTTNIAGVSYSIGTLTITGGFGGNIGSSTDAYSTTGNIAKIVCYGRGQYYKIGSTGNVGTSISNQSQIVLQPGAVFQIASGTWQFAAIQGARLEVGASAVLTTQIALIGVSGQILSNGTGITLLDIDGSSDITCYRALTEVNIESGSTLRQTGSAAITKAVVSSGGTLNLRPTAAATHTNLWIKNGGIVTLDGAAAVPTVTNLYRWPTAAIQKSNGGVSMTVTNDYPQASSSLSGTMIP